MWYAAAVAVAVGLLLLNLAMSLAALRRLDTFAPVARTADAWPLISALIPARDEAATIATCLASLLAQSYPRIEILVLDDESSDDTAAIVARIAAGDPEGRVRLLRGAPLPVGWLGKCHACHQLALAARGEVLLFTDADTVHGATSLASALAAIEQRHLGVMSALPRQIARTPAEKLLIPLLPLNILALLPVGLMRRRSEPSLSAGVGQFLCFRRAAYLASGGHVAVRDRVLDDVTLARRVKAAGWRADLLDGGHAVRCRMYDSLGAIWRGFSKNLFDFYGRSPLVTIAAVLARLALFVAPLPLALAGTIAHWPAGTVALLWAAYAGAVAMRLAVAWRVGAQGTDLCDAGAWLSALLHPLAEALHCAITLSSLRWGMSRHLQWKGRDYRPGSPLLEERQHGII